MSKQKNKRAIIIDVDGSMYDTFKKDDRKIIRDIFLNNDIINTAKKLKLNIHYGTIMTADVFTVYADVSHIYNKMPKHIELLANEMEAFGLFHIANVSGKEATCLMTIVDSPYEKIMLTQEEKEKNLNNMILLALESI